METFVGSGAPLTQAGLGQALAKAGAPPEALWAVLAVETSGCGYLSDRRPKILFERHIFHRLTQGRFDAQEPNISAPTSGGYGAAGSHQYERLALATALSPREALMSASWGLGQIMGENCKTAGFADVEAMVTAFVESEDAQLSGMATFIVASGLAESMREKQWAKFAFRYNGADYASNDYDGHLALFCAHFESRGCPDIRVRACQVFLTYLGFSPGGTDGFEGDLTRRAVTDYQRSRHQPETGVIDTALLQSLAAA